MYVSLNICLCTICWLMMIVLATRALVYHQILVHMHRLQQKSSLDRIMFHIAAKRKNKVRKLIVGFSLLWILFLLKHCLLKIQKETFRTTLWVFHLLQLWKYTMPIIYSIWIVSFEKLRSRHYSWCIPRVTFIEPIVICAYPNNMLSPNVKHFSI